MSQRIGTFEVIYRLEDTSDIQDVLSKVKVLKSEKLYSSFSTRYTAESDLFDEVEDGADVPEYQILFTRHPDGNVTWEFKKRVTT